MNIFEQLENLNVSEGCFDDIMDIVETLMGNFAVPATDEFGKSYLRGKYSEEATPKEKRKALASDELLRKNVTKEDPRVKKSIKRHKKSLAESIEILEAIFYDEWNKAKKKLSEGLDDNQIEKAKSDYIDSLKRLRYSEKHDRRHGFKDKDSERTKKISDRTFELLKTLDKEQAKEEERKPKTKHELELDSDHDYTNIKAVMRGREPNNSFHPRRNV